MNKKQTQRLASLLPNNEPKYVRIYDNGGVDAWNGTIDRYTVVFSGNYTKGKGYHQNVTMSKDPYWPQGVCMHGEDRNMIDAPQGWPPAIGRKWGSGYLSLHCPRIVNTLFSMIMLRSGSFLSKPLIRL